MRPEGWLLFFFFGVRVSFEGGNVEEKRCRYGRDGVYRLFRYFLVYIFVTIFVRFPRCFSMGVVMGRIRRWAAVCVVLVLPMAVGCAGFFPDTNTTSGGGTTPTNTGDYAYVASAYVSGSTAAYTLSGFSVGTGTLTALSGFPITLPFPPTATVINPSNTISVCGGAGRDLWLHDLVDRGADADCEQRQYRAGECERGLDGHLAGWAVAVCAR